MEPTVIDAVRQKLSKIDTLPNKVMRAQHALLALRVAREMNGKQTKEAEGRHPLKPLLDRLSEQVDALEVDSFASPDEWKVAVDRAIYKMREPGDQMERDCKSLYEADKTLRKMIFEAEKNLLRMCKETMLRGTATEVIELIDRGLAGTLWHGTSFAPGPMDKLVAICLSWNGRVR